MEKILVIVGPTGVGKTSLSVALATQLHGEIISGDSMQVYKEMNIGTAKITEAETKGIPHYLINAYSFVENYHVKLFQERSRSYIKEIQEKHKLAILCGGTGLYIKSTIYDYAFLKQEEDSSFMAFLHTCSEDELWAMLQVVDPSACVQLHKHNRQRILRALSMAHTGKKKSDCINQQEHKKLYDAYIIGLTMDRQQLYDRINTRVDQMVQEGLLEEITRLQTLHDYVWDLQSFQGIGYKEWKDYFMGSATSEQCIEQIKKNSRNFAKRQYTWFNNQMEVHWYDVTKVGYKDTILNDIHTWLGA